MNTFVAWKQEMSTFTGGLCELWARLPLREQEALNGDIFHESPTTAVSVKVVKGQTKYVYYIIFSTETCETAQFHVFTF